MAYNAINAYPLHSPLPHVHLPSHEGLPGRPWSPRKIHKVTGSADQENGLQLLPQTLTVISLQTEALANYIWSCGPHAIAPNARAPTIQHATRSERLAVQQLP